MNLIVQRILAVFAVIVIIGLFYQYKKEESAQRFLTEKLQAQTRATDSLQQELTESSAEKGVLKAENELKKLEINRANEVLANILGNMDEIAAREADVLELIRENNPERRGRLISSKDYRKIDHEINSFLEAMYTTLNSSRQSVAGLEGELEVAMDDNEQLKSFVMNLRRMVESQEQTISRLKEEKDALLKQLAQYEEENQVLRKAWVTIGTRDELRKKDIVRKPFFRPLEVNVLDSTRFSSFDIRQQKIPLGDKVFKDVNVVSEHKKYPELFGISKDGKSLEIKDPKQFWRVSKFLIVEVDY